MSTAIVRVRCPDRKGIIADLSDFVFRNGGNILDLDQHTDAETGRFYMRLVFGLGGFGLDEESVRLGLQFLARKFTLDWELDFGDRRDRIAVWCSKELHCAYDLLLRRQLGELEGDIALIVSNHSDVEETAKWFGVPFAHVPVPAGGKEQAEARQQQLMDEHHINLVVLARYMQILSPGLVGRWAGRVI